MTAQAGRAREAAGGAAHEGLHARTPDLALPRDAATAAAGLVWIELKGPEITDDERALVAQGAGGVVLFGASIRSVEQLRGLTAELRSMTARPLRIAIDHEGGHVARLGAPLTRFPSAMAIGATGSPALAREVARAAGEELASLGIDVNLAPVLDLAGDPRNPSLGARTFGSSPEHVAAWGAAAVRGLRDAGIAATAKHFPGHGRTPIDSHVAVPTVSGGMDALAARDLPPFAAAIAAGVDIVMASHVVYDEVTGGLPATISSRVLRDLLRAELGFEGLVITDALVMRGLTDLRPIDVACVEAVAAGADAVMPMRGAQAAGTERLRAAITSGELPAHRVHDALARAAALDDRLRRQGPGGTGERAPLSLPSPEHTELARTVARRSLTLVRGASLLPIPAGTSVAVIEFASRRPSPVEESVGPAPSLGGALATRLHRVREVVVDGREGPGAHAAAREAAGAAEIVVLATRDAYLWPEERELVAEIAAGDRPTILVALRNPYDTVALARTTAAIAAYADVPVTLEALADALAGGAELPGRLPMDLPHGDDPA